MPYIHPAALKHERKRWMRADAHRFIRLDWRRFVKPGSELEALYESFERKYRPDQPRAPRGQPEGWQWTSEGSGGDEIPTNAKPIQFSPSKEGWHQYQSGPNVVCPTDLQCSSEQIADQLARYSVPGQNPAAPVENNRTYPVYDPDTGLYVGSVQTMISNDGLTITNRTLPGHIFYDGAIIRNAMQAADGSWTVTTEGIGNNVIPGMSDINQMAGPGIFNSLDQRMRNNIERHHAKGIVTALAIGAGRRRGLAFRVVAGGAEYVES